MDLRAERVTLNKLFGTKGEQFQVPPYQRPYAWGSEQIDDLWDDLVSSLEEGHFLGTVVLTDDLKDRPQIIDGQQRLTTLMVLFGLIRDEYVAIESPLAGRVQDMMMSDPYASGDEVFRLRTGDANWRPFRDLVLRGPADPQRLSDATLSQLPTDIRAKNKALFDNRRRLVGKLSDWLGESGVETRGRQLERLEKAIAGAVQMVAIRVGSVADAFLLFETLNDRGLQLSAGDLLKNHLLSQVAQGNGGREQVREAAIEWDRLLDDLGPTVDVTRFLRHFLLIKVPRIKKDDVFDRFKQEADRVGPYKLLQELRASGRLYGEFENPMRVEHPQVRAVLDDLKTLRATSCYTALMPARRYLSSLDFVAFARLAEVLTFRHSTIGGLDSKELEGVYHRSARILAESEGSDIDEARRELIAMMPDSEQFKRAFMNQRMGRHYLVRYTLGRIEEHISEEGEKQFRSNTKVHIEHILPQTLSDHWKAELGDDGVEEHSDYVNRWGNLTLLYYKWNIAASNDAFARKKMKYANSEVALTKRLCEREAWSYAAIVDRQAWLAEVADEIWSVAEGRPEVRDPQRGEPQDYLQEPERSAFLGLLVETSAEEAEALIGPIESYVETLLKDATGDVGESARAVGEALCLLAHRAGALDGLQRSWLRAAVEYFVLEDDLRPDSAPGGLSDDAAIVGAVCRALGCPELLPGSME